MISSHIRDIHLCIEIRSYAGRVEDKDRKETRGTVSAYRIVIKITLTSTIPEKPSVPPT